MNNFQFLLIATVVLFAAIVGKGAACWLAARLNGESNRTALAVGTLMNARGLMELIILNIGLQKGIIQPALVFDHGHNGNRNHANGLTGIRTGVSEKAEQLLGIRTQLQPMPNCKLTRGVLTK